MFLLCAEILANKIRHNKSIKGIKIGNQEIKISLFADDTSLILDGREASLRAALGVLADFAKLLGLNINLSKTQVIWIGSKKCSKDVLCPDIKLDWGKTSFSLLGIDFDVDLVKINQVKINQLNYDKKLVKIKGTIKRKDKPSLH